jgi:hypothetical protein
MFEFSHDSGYTTACGAVVLGSYMRRERIEKKEEGFNA